MNSEQLAVAFEAFVKAHPLVTCILLAWIVSWTLTVTFRPFIKAATPETLERHTIRLFDVALAGVVAWYMWPADYAVIWGMAIGGASPIAYLAFSEALCWKWPALRPRFSLREFTDNDSPTEGKDS